MTDVCAYSAWDDGVRKKCAGTNTTKREGMLPVGLLFGLLALLLLAALARLLAMRAPPGAAPARRCHVVVAACGDPRNVKRIREMACGGGGECVVWVYNKCAQKVPGSVRLPNVGRDLHTFLHHVVEHYSALPAGRIIFTASTLDKHRRAARLERLLHCEEDHFCDWGHGAQAIGDIWTDWTKDEYDGVQLLPASPRGFRSWCEAHTGAVDPSSKRCGNGIFLTTGARIRKRPPEFYRNLRDQLCTHNAPEAVHYLERVVEHVFM